MDSENKVGHRPRIGITTIPRDNLLVTSTSYVQAIERGGGLPILIPPTLSQEVAGAFAALLDGLLIPGGRGVTAGLIGMLPDDLPPEEESRWQADVLYLRAMVERKRPVLGICFGMQLINAVYGGTIYADVSAQRPGTLNHAARRGGPGTHLVQPEPDSFLAHLIGREALPVNTHHVQAVVDVGENLRVNAISEDGIIEGVETEDGLLLGVQFHPELLEGEPWTDLFRGFVQRANINKGGKEQRTPLV